MAKKLNAGQMAKRLAELGGGAIKKGGGGMVKGVEVIMRTCFHEGQLSMYQRIVQSLGSMFRLGSGKK